MLVKEWFRDFIIKHETQCPSSLWSEMPPDYRRVWLSKFIEHNVTKAEADAASSFLAECELHPNQHLPRLIGAVKASRQTSLAGNRAAAEAGSSNCPECGGTGKVVARVLSGWGWFNQHVNQPYTSVRGYESSPLHRIGSDGQLAGPSSFTCWCPKNCALARWDRSHLDPEIASRILDLSTLPPESFTLRSVSRWLRHDEEASPVSTPHLRVSATKGVRS